MIINNNQNIELENYLILFCILNNILIRDKTAAKLIHDINNQLTYLKLESEAVANKKFEQKVDQLISKIKDLSNEILTL